MLPLEAELNTKSSSRASSSNCEQALVAELAAERTAREAVVSELEAARAMIRELRSEGGPDPESAALQSENAELKAHLRALERQVDEQRTIMSEQELRLREIDKTEAQAELSSAPEEAASPSRSQKRRRFSTSVWDACQSAAALVLSPMAAKHPFHTTASTTTADAQTVGQEVLVTEKQLSQSSSAPSAADAVSRVVDPSQPDFDAVTQAASLRKVLSVDDERSAPPPDVPGLRIYDRRAKRPRPPVPVPQVGQQ
jgi:predicted DNA-binding transcriptional regulator YafY